MISTTDNAFGMLEDGELSNSSIEISSADLHSTADCFDSYLSNCSTNLSSSNYSATGLSNCSSNQTKLHQTDQSLVDSERSLFEIFSMDVSHDHPVVKPKKTFTGWTDQLVEEQSKQKYQDTLAEKLAKQKQTREESLRKRELIKLQNFSNDISRCLREKRSDLVYKIVEACGYDKSSELCAEAQQIYSTTGMLTTEGRKRTLGGCFFQLVKTKGGLNDAQKKEIFYVPTAMMPQRIKQKKNARKKLKQQVKSQSNNKLEQIRSELASMNLNISVRLK